MPFGNMFMGFADRMAQDIVQKRQQQRQAEDADIDYQMKIIEGLINRPNVNPNILNRAISDLATLHSAKAPGARKIKGSGYSSQTEMPVSQIMQSIASGMMPMQGPTTEQVPRPVGEQIEMTRGAELQPFNPQSLPQIKSGGMGGMDTIVPPAPVGPPPMITPLQRAAKQAEMKTQMLPMERQPLLLSDEEVAQQEGQAAGVRAGAIESAKQKADMEAALQVMSPEEWKQLQLNKHRGAAGLEFAPDLAPEYMQDVEGNTVARYTPFNKATGEYKPYDIPLPPGYKLAPKPGATAIPRPGTPDQQALEAFVAAAEAKAGRPLTPQEKSAAIEQWQTADANRKRPVTHVSVGGQGGFSPEDNRIFNAIQRIQSNYEKSRGDLTKIESNVGMMNASLQQLESDLKHNGTARLGPAHQSIIYGFNHAIEPQSVVREAEYDRSLHGQGWYDRVRGLAQRMDQGGVGLTLEEVREYARLANQIMAGAQKRFRTQLLTTYAKQAQQIPGADLASIFRLDDYNFWQQMQAEIQRRAAGGGAAPTGMPTAPTPKKSLSGFIKGNGIQK